MSEGGMNFRIVRYLCFFVFLTLLCPLLSWAVQQPIDQETCPTPPTPLVAAIQARDSIEARRLIKSGADLNTRICGTTPLIESITIGVYEVTEKLVLAGASVNLRAGKDETPLMIAAWYCRIAAVPLLVEHGADVNAVDEDGYSPLMGSSQNCEDGGVPALLLSRGAEINLVAKDGNTALMIAAFYGNEHVVHVLVGAGADLTAKDADGETALSIARDRDVGRKHSHDRIYHFLLQVIGRQEIKK